MFKINLISCFVLIGILFTACKKDNFKEDPGVCPEIVMVDPGDQSTSVSLNKDIKIVFNTAMNPSTINTSSITLTGSSAVAGSVTYEGVTATFTPSSLLLANTTYTGRVKTSVKDPKGNALQVEYVWTFSTGTTVAPVVLYTDPTDAENNVVLNKVITAEFSMPMDATTITQNTFVLSEGSSIVSGVVSYTNNTAKFTPSSDLLAGKIYTVKLDKSIKSMSGITLANDYVWTFTTGTQTGPVVIKTDPIDLQNNVDVKKNITATFNQTMDPSTLNGSTFLLHEGTTSVSGIVTCVDTVATFAPTSDLLPGKTYTAKITTGAQNSSGTALANTYIWTFNTKATVSTIDLKSVEQFGIISGVGVSNQAGPSQIYNMDVGIYPGMRTAITGFFLVDGGPGQIINGSFYASDDNATVSAMLLQAKNDLTSAYLQAEGASMPAPATVSGDIGGITLAPGIYKSTSTLLIQSGNLTLDAQGDPNAMWIFQIASDFTTVGGAGGNVVLIGGAQAKNVVWQVGSSATIGDFTTFSGNILALTSVTMNSGATAVGRMLCINGAIVLTNTNIINKP